MNRLLALMICGAGFFGCAATNRTGDFTSNASAGLIEGIAADTTKQLETLYPPAQTQFSIGQPVSKSDVFGSIIVASMRAKGYAIQEFAPSPGVMKLQYVIDKPTAKMPDLYRIKLKVDGVTLTRAYVAQNNTARPAGAWARME